MLVKRAGEELVAVEPMGLIDVGSNPSIAQHVCPCAGTKVAHTRDFSRGVPVCTLHVASTGILFPMNSESRLLEREVLGRLSKKTRF